MLPIVGGPSRGSIAEVARLAEAAGFDSLWASSHVVFPAAIRSRYPYDGGKPSPYGPHTVWADAITALAFAAALTERVRLGTAVIPLTTVSPLVLGKQAATLDLLSDGRLELGIGAGWLAEEAEVLGFPASNRVKRLEDTIELLRVSWSRPLFEYRGRTLSVPEAGQAPPPPQGAALPLWIGGHGANAMRIAEEHGTGMLLRLAGPEEVAFRRRSLRPRTPLGAMLSLDLERRRWLEESQRLAEAGLDLLILTRTFPNPDHLRDLERFAEEVLPQLETAP